MDETESTDDTQVYLRQLEDMETGQEGSITFVAEVDPAIPEKTELEVMGSIKGYLDDGTSDDEPAGEDNRVSVESRSRIVVTVENFRTYIPGVLKPAVKLQEVKEPEPAGQPDLFIESISLEPNTRDMQAGDPVEMTVVVKNQGTEAASSFWVDMYINPDEPPANAGKLWYDTCTVRPCLGIAWLVEELQPGETIELTSTEDSFNNDFTSWWGWFASGTTDVYVYADCWRGKDGSSSDGGAVEESDEENNRIHISGLSVTGENPAVPSLMNTFPPR
jgi:hypothetical protein